MTARTAGPDPPAVFLPRNTRAFDRRLLRVSLFVAVALHCGALMLPLPAAPDVVAPEPPPGPILEIGELLLAPPKLPERPLPQSQSSARKISVPMSEALDLEPVVTPGEPRKVDTSDGPEQDWGLLAPVARPPADEPLAEGLPGLIPPRIVGARTPPVYPELGRKIRAEGVVVLRAVIDVDGTVTSIEILQAPEPDVGFGEAAVRAVSNWRYAPGILRGRPVPVYVTVYVEFELH